jgi:3-deoxy-D-manno-octulosonic-acid transferase
MPPPSLFDQMFTSARKPGAALPASLSRLPAPLIWLHADHMRAAQMLAGFSETLSQRAPGIGILLTSPELPPDLAELPNRICLPLSADHPDPARQILERISPAVALIAAQTLPANLIRSLTLRRIPVFLVETEKPRLGSRWQRLPGIGRHLLAGVETVFVQNAASKAVWLDMGVREGAIVRAGRLSGMPVALRCNEAEREELSEAFRHRTLWLAAGLPEREEAAVLAAHREALRESHRLALILQPADPMRGPELRARCAEQFVTALRSLDDPVTPETQVYVADTDGERGLWYRLAVACYLGGTLGADGPSLSPMEAAGLGCAIVHGRMFGRYSEAFDLLREARATRMIQGAESLGSAVCTALRPEQAADQAHRAWQVISAGSAATETIMSALLVRTSPKGKS